MPPAKLRPLAGVWPEPTAFGLTLLAVSETALDAGAVLLDAVYENAVSPGPRQVCYLRNPDREPIMDVFVRTPAIRAPAVLCDLDERRALKHFSAIQGKSWLVRAEAPMATLLGYGRRLAALTAGSADHWITFNRWEPAPRFADFRRVPETLSVRTAV